MSKILQMISLIPTSLIWQSRSGLVFDRVKFVMKEVNPGAGWFKLISIAYNRFMEYITGFYALNLPCRLGTTGDWHRHSLNWNKPNIKNSKNSIFHEYGIETNRDLSFVGLKSKYNVANHIRACLDIIEEGNEKIIRYFASDFLDDNPIVIDEFLNKCLLFKDSERWNEVDDFLKFELFSKWESAKRKNGIGNCPPSQKAINHDAEKNITKTLHLRLIF